MRERCNASEDHTESRGLKARRFSLLSIREAHRMVVRACGRLVLGDGASEQLWVPYLDKPAATHVALDLSCVDDVDARGLGVLAALVRRARQRGTRVSVVAASGVVQRLAELTGLAGAVPGAWNERTGVSACGAGPAAMPDSP